MNIDLFEKELKKFNSTSKCPIDLTVKKHSNSANLFNCNNLLIVTPPSYGFIFELVNTYSRTYPYTEYTIVVDEIEHVEKAFRLSKLICKAMSLKYDIHFLIYTHCSQIIKEHKEGMEEWREYLDNWSSNCTLSCYESFDQARQAYTRYAYCLEKKILEYLNRYYKETLINIVNDNQQMKEFGKEAKQMLTDQTLRIEVNGGISMNEKTLYYFDWNKECIK